MRVKIYGTEYPIKADADPEHIQEIAEYVDAKMQEILTDPTTPSLIGGAILAALNIADELYKERESKQKAMMELDDQISGLIRRLEQVL